MAISLRFGRRGQIDCVGEMSSSGMPTTSYLPHAFYLLEWKMELQASCIGVRPDFTEHE